MKHLLAFLIGLGATSLLRADSPAVASPFCDLTVAEALVRARVEKKPVLLFFDGYWSDEARQARREIFEHPDMRDGIRAHAVAVHIDVLAAPRLTEKYSVVHVPTLVWLDSEGLPLSRSHAGSASDLRRRITQNIIRTAETRANVQDEDHQGRLLLCRTLVRTREHAQALTALRALYMDAIRRPSGKLPPNATRVAMTDVISLFNNLSRTHWQAAEVAREILAHEESLIRSAPGEAEAARRFCEIASISGDIDRIQSLHDSLPAGAARKILSRHVSK
jgi:hypothetical protein